MSFSQLGLSQELVQATLDKGYTQPTPIQQQSIPVILKGRNLLACAQTGTGKTASFTLPLLDRLSKTTEPCHEPRALVLAPTRELALQIHDSLKLYGQHLSLRSAVVFGGVKVFHHVKALEQGVDVLVATPGRLLDLAQQKAVSLHKIQILVLDEADRMLDMGFIQDIRKVLKLCPKQRQNLLFSATLTRDVQQFAQEFIDSPVQIDVTPKEKTAVKVHHHIHPVDKRKKAELLCHLIQEQQWYQALVFCRTKHGADKLVKLLNFFDIQAQAIHSNKSQNQRMKALERFKEGKLAILVATDIAARGLDIKQLPQVVNFDLPDVPEDYIHRIGRTGRAGQAGLAISLVCADEIKPLLAIEKLLNHNLKREYVPGFEPEHELPSRAPKVIKTQSPPKSPKSAAPKKKSYGNQGKPFAKAKKSGRTKRRNYVAQ